MRNAEINSRVIYEIGSTPFVPSDIACACVADSLFNLDVKISANIYNISTFISNDIKFLSNIVEI